MSIVPGWHATIFAPYFVAGAIFSGFAMVLTVMIPVRRIYGLEEHPHRLPLREHVALPPADVDASSSYAYGVEYFIAWYSGVESEKTGFFLRAFGPYWISTWIMIICNGVFPQLLLVQAACARTCRRSSCSRR